MEIWEFNSGLMRPRCVVFAVPDMQQAEQVQEVQVVPAPGEQVVVLPSPTEEKEKESPASPAEQVEPRISASVLVESSPSLVEQVKEEVPASPGEWCWSYPQPSSSTGRR